MNVWREEGLHSSSDLVWPSVVVPQPGGQTVVFDQRIQALRFLHEQPELAEERKERQKGDEKKTKTTTDEKTAESLSVERCCTVK